MFSPCFVLIALAACFHGTTAGDNDNAYLVNGDFIRHLAPVLDSDKEVDAVAHSPKSLQQLANSLNTNSTQERIWGGTETFRNEYPFLVNLEITMGRDIYFCSGVIVNPNYILTVAQCLTPSVDTIKVTAGDHDLYSNDGTEQIQYGTRTIVNGSYNPSTFAYDMGLVELRNPFRMTDAVQYAFLADPTFPGGGALNTYIAGWGSSIVDGSLSARLRKASLTTVTNAYCRTAYSGINPIQDNMICAESSASSGCTGDGGSPLICRTPVDGNFVCGSISFMVGCRAHTYPNGFQRTSSFLSWIRGIAGTVYTAGYTAPTTTTTTTTTTTMRTTVKWGCCSGSDFKVNILLTFLCFMTSKMVLSFL